MKRGKDKVTWELLLVIPTTSFDYQDTLVLGSLTPKVKLLLRRISPLGV